MASGVRTALRAGLRQRQSEIEQAVLTRVMAVPDPPRILEPEYAEGLRAAVAAAVEFGLAAVEAGDEGFPPLPISLLAQARLAARAGVGLDTVLRRYVAGYVVLGDFILEEAEADGRLRVPDLQRLLRAHASLFDRLLATVSADYAREADGRLSAPGRRRAERIKRLLDGELIDLSELEYDFDEWHTGTIASGRGANALVGELGAALDCRLLVVRPDEVTTWAWLGARRPVDPSELEGLVSATATERVAVAVGGAGRGIEGWRRTHLQAAAALPVALRGKAPLTLYSEVALLASALRDDLLVASLRESFLAPLERERDGGRAARETLRAFLAAGRNVSSAAAALGVNRHTVTSRLRAIEERIGAPLDSCAADIELALELEALGDPAPRRPTTVASLLPPR